MSPLRWRQRFETTVTAVCERYVGALSGLRGFFRSKALEP